MIILFFHDAVEKLFDYFSRKMTISNLFSGSGGWLRVFREAAAGDSVQCAELLRGVRQCRLDDDRRRDAHVLIPGVSFEKARNWNRFAVLLSDRVVKCKVVRKVQLLDIIFCESTHFTFNVHSVGSSSQKYPICIDHVFLVWKVESGFLSEIFSELYFSYW